MTNKENIKILTQQLHHLYKCLELNLTISVRKVIKIIRIQQVMENYPVTIKQQLQNKVKELEVDLKKYDSITKTMKIRIVNLKFAIKQNEKRKSRRRTKYLNDCHV